MTSNTIDLHLGGCGGKDPEKRTRQRGGNETQKGRFCETDRENKIIYIILQTQQH